MKTKTLVHNDLKQIMQIVSETFIDPWTEEEMVRQLSQAKCMSMAIQCGNKIVGFLLYELHKTYFRIVNFAVLPSHRRQGVGTRMMNNVIKKLNHKTTHIVLDVRERSLETQLFMRTQKFTVVKVLKGYYPDDKQDAYLFQYERRANLKVEQAPNGRTW